MEKEWVITIDHCCTQYQVEKEFIVSLSEYGIINIIREEEEAYIAHDDLGALEKSIEFQELGINLAGIDTIFHLLGKIESLQQELLQLKRFR